MELRDYITAGLERKGSVSTLASYLGIAPTSIADAKAHRRGLPNDACFKLAELLGADVRGVIAASELATERKEEKRAFWRPFVSGSDFARIAGYALILGIVTNFVTTYPAEAAPLLGLADGTICIMLSRKIISCRKGFLRLSVAFTQILSQTSLRSFGIAVRIAPAP